MKLLLILSIIISFSFSKELETKINDFLIDWDNAHNNKSITLFDKLYSDNINYYNGRNFSKMQVLEDKIKRLNKYPDFRQISKFVSKEEISNQLLKINYEKNTSYNNKNQIFNSYLILDFTNEQFKIIEENDNKAEQKNTNTTMDSIKKTEEVKPIVNNNIRKDTYSNKSVDWKDLKVYESYRWKKLGINNPNEAKEWEDVVPQFMQIQSWIEQGYNPNQVKEWLSTNIYISVYDIEATKLKNPQELKKWSDLGILQAYQIQKIKRLGILTPEEAKEWKILNIELDDSYSGVSSCIYARLSPQEVKKWFDIGEKYCQDIEKWKKLGINTPIEAQKWIDYKLKPSNDLDKWFAQNIKSPLEIREWLDLGIDFRYVKDWLEKGITSQEAKEWKIVEKTSFSLSRIKEIKLLGINSAQELNEWYSTRFQYISLNDINKLKELGINSSKELEEWNFVPNNISEVIWWKEAKINSPQEAKEWLSIGVNSAKAKELIQMNYKPIDLKDYSPNILNSFQIKMLKDLNIKASPLIESMASSNGIFFRINFFATKEKFIEYLDILSKNKCQKIEKGPFYLADEYDNENLCYTFEGTLFQRLNKTEGLLSSGNNYINYVIFNESWSEGSLGFGIIKGLGSIKYETTSGKEKLVRKGKAIILNTPKF